MVRVEDVTAQDRLHRAQRPPATDAPASCIPANAGSSPLPMPAAGGREGSSERRAHGLDVLAEVDDRSSGSVAGSGARPGSAPTARNRSTPGPNRRGVSGWPARSRMSSSAARRRAADRRASGGPREARYRGGPDRPGPAHARGDPGRARRRGRAGPLGLREPDRPRDPRRRAAAGRAAGRGSRFVARRLALAAVLDEPLREAGMPVPRLVDGSAAGGPPVRRHGPRRRRARQCRCSTTRWTPSPSGPRWAGSRHGSPRHPSTGSAARRSPSCAARGPTPRPSRRPRSARSTPPSPTSRRPPPVEARHLLDRIPVAFAGRRAMLQHGDWAPVNVVVRERAVVAVVDWEDARLADPLLDLAWWSWIVWHHHRDRYPAAAPALFETAGVELDAPTVERVRILVAARLLEHATRAARAGDAVDPPPLARPVGGGGRHGGLMSPLLSQCATPPRISNLTRVERADTAADSVHNQPSPHTWMHGRMDACRSVNSGSVRPARVPDLRERLLAQVPAPAQRAAPSPQPRRCPRTPSPIRPLPGAARRGRRAWASISPRTERPLARHRPPAAA